MKRGAGREQDKWIWDCADQELVYHLIIEAIGFLEELDIDQVPLRRMTGAGLAPFLLPSRDAVPSPQQIPTASAAGYAGA